MTGLVSFGGHTDEQFREVEDVFRANFTQTGAFAEIGAGLAVYFHGKRVVSIHGGLADTRTKRAWDDRTLVNIWSSTKGLIAIAFARLVERGLVDYEDRVADHWPEFSQGGKQDIRLIELLSHQSGLNGFQENTSIEDFEDWALVTNRLAEQPPLWQPGKFTSYHAMTFGFLVGEVARRVTGQAPRDWLKEDLARVVQADIYLGAPKDQLHRVAPVVPPNQWATSSRVDDEIAQHGMINPAPEPEWANRSGWRASQVPAANGHATADGLARPYAALANGGQLEDVQLLSPAMIEELRKVRSTRDDRMLGPRIWGSGVVLNKNDSFGPNPGAFGHAGWGGSFGCADPESGIAIGYVLNHMGPGVIDDPRARQISKAVFDCVDRIGA